MDTTSYCIRKAFFLSLVIAITYQVIRTETVWEWKIYFGNKSTRKRHKNVWKNYRKYYSRSFSIFYVGKNKLYNSCGEKNCNRKKSFFFLFFHSATFFLFYFLFGKMPAFICCKKNIFKDNFWSNKFNKLTEKTVISVPILFRIK